MKQPRVGVFVYHSVGEEVAGDVAIGSNHGHESRGLPAAEHLITGQLGKASDNRLVELK